MTVVKVRVMMKGEGRFASASIPTQLSDDKRIADVNAEQRKGRSATASTLM